MTNVGSVYQDYRVKDEKGGILSVGRMLAGQNGTFPAAAFGMRQLKSFIATPWMNVVMTAGTKVEEREFFTASGSIGSYGVVDNYVRVRNYRHSPRESALGSNLSKGTYYIGTLAGSFRLSYIAVGL